MTRSVSLDSWTLRQLYIMELGGNPNATAYLKKLGKENFEGYKGEFAKKYVAQLQKRVDEKMAEIAAENPQKSSAQGAVKQAAPVAIQKVAGLSTSATTDATQNDNPQASPDSKQKDEKDLETMVIDKGNLKSKKFAVTFNSKAGGPAKNKQKLTGERLDEDIDFNKLSLGDAVNEDTFRQAKTEKMKKDLFPEEEEKKNKGDGIKEVVSIDSSSAAEKDNFVDKYKNKTAIGSEDLNKGSGGGKKDSSQFEGRSGFGSDDVSGKPKNSPTTGGVDYQEKFYEAKEKLSDAKDKIVEKAGDWYNKLKTKMGK
jgi:hypothetical protein